MPFSVVASLALLLMCIDGEVSRWDAAILFVGFMVFLGYTLYLARKGVAQNVEVVKLENMSYWKACGLMLLGLACLVLGSHLFVDGATEVARSLGIPDAVIGLTIVALGTSLPELATSVVAARKGQSAIAIGNVIGSNVFNILMILGITGLVLPMDIHSITSVDFAVLLGSITLLWLFCYTKYTVEKWEGGVLTLAYVVYVGWLVYRVL